MMPGALIITRNTRLDVAQVPTTAQHAHLRELERVANELRSRESHDDDEVPAVVMDAAVAVSFIVMWVVMKSAEHVRSGNGPGIDFGSREERIFWIFALVAVVIIRRLIYWWIDRRQRASSGLDRISRGGRISPLGEDAPDDAADEPPV